MISPIGLRRLALRYEGGAVQKGERNWEKGFPLSRCVDSALRHLSQIMEGDTSEDHWAAVAWQAFAAMHFEEMINRGTLPESLDDLPKNVLGPHIASGDRPITREDQPERVDPKARYIIGDE